MNRMLQIAVFCSVSLATALPGFTMPTQDTEAPQAAEIKEQARKDSLDHYFRGVTCESSGHIDEAMREYRQVIQISPAHGDARRRLAEIHLLRGELSDSIAQIRELVRYQGNNPVIRFQLARLYESKGNYRKACAEYRETVKLAPKNLSARRRLALLYEKRKMFDEAAVEYRRILVIDGNDKSVQNALIALYLRGKKFANLSDFLKETVARKPDDPTGHYKLGLVYEFTKNYDGAAEEYGKAIELNTSYAKAMNALARVYLKANRIDEAKKLLEVAKTVDPTFRESVLLLRSIREEFKPRYAAKKKSSHGESRKKKRKKVKGSKKKRRS
jgi:tetratricopeptide (TPR) repeat protein